MSVTSSLLTVSLCRVTRNPMYVGVVLAVVWQALFYRSPSLAILDVLLWTFFQLNVVFGEQRHLRAQYSESYDAYCRLVPRWLC